MESAIVATRQGKVRGRILENGVSAYLGIPYAAPPFGANRFREPRPPCPWDGVRDTAEYGPTVPKPRYPRPYDRLLPDPDVPGEDCLNLNVWTPDPGATGLPVMVWIHGGAFRNGSGAVPIYSGANFARDGVVFVTLNYRLGVEGFAHFPDAPSNRGLLDQISALSWVRDNIAGFGGDPDDVTVFGESAGAMSVTTLLSLDLGLFRRAAAQSGGGNVAQTPEDAALITRETAARLGVEPTAAAFADLDPARIIPVQAAVAAEVSMLPDPGRWGVTTSRTAMSHVPVLDGELLSRTPEDAIADGAGADTDLLIGYNAEEFRLFLMPNGLAGLITEDVLTPMASAMGVPARVIDAHRDLHGTPGELLAAVISESLFRIPATRVAERHRASTWMYEFAWRSPVHDLGACHALELGFVFDNLHVAGTEGLAGPNPPQPLADTMHKAWVDFAVDGAPGWPRYTPETRRTRRFGDPRNPLVSAPGEALRRLWDA
ncbi:carboxylesterase/lipase family protein [Actinomadura logoneensis]|uniref:Carboxylic ester hydrolase n=1 Tax=Actinomadura logoneensis TaxID=2293572 RepID=A0A372JQ49_9ACTN|nr:carboxylesterase family protein [Actinomadura logoneensis]RFU42142.1 carboxylesterase/lipase family protein [Actinomadura logoneensis]